MSIRGPKSLYTRFLLITILPLIIIQLISAYIFYERHWESLSRNMMSALTNEVATVVKSVQNLPEEEQEKFIIPSGKTLGLKVSIKKDATVNTYKNVNSRYTQLLGYLDSKIDQDAYIFREDQGRLRFAIPVNNNVVNITFDGKRIANPSTYIFMLWMSGSSILLMIISILFLKNQVRSIIYLSKAAERFGKGSDLEDFKPSGAKEIRAAGIAFIEMKERIRRLIDTRTQMLAGVSHDLKTPLTRMKLIISLLTDKLRKDELSQEVNEMSKMIEGYLSFTQLDSPSQLVEAISETNLKEFIDETVERYRHFPNKIEADIADNIFLHIRSEYFKRAASNLIDNSLKYAKSIKISADIDAQNAYIIFEDDGPGIPEDKYEKVFQPFYRLDESRNSETGGVGLGLSIARDIVQKHGGDIQLSRSATLGGLKATIVLPR